MNRIFIDTSALVALKNHDDEHHERALECLKAALHGPPTRFLLTNYILSEVHAYFCRTPGVALAYLEELLQDASFQVVRATATDERRALALLRGARDKSWSYADAVSFAVTERLSVRLAFAFDRHFRQYGRLRLIT